MNIGNIGPHLLQDKRNRPLGWNNALGELIDNSFDAGASRVEIDLSKQREVSVADDGKGCDDVCRMLTIANHKPYKTTGLGRYGVGLKDAGCWLWGELRIRTAYGGKETLVTVNWDRLSRQDDWEIAEPFTIDATEETPVGTRLRFSRIEQQKPSLEKLASDLGYMFWPGLSEGRQIVIAGARKKRFICAAWQPPPLSDIVEDAFEVEGKGVILRAGIVPADDSNPRFGFNFFHKHRCIMRSSMGSNGHSTSRLCGIVKLDEKWALATNKNEICAGQEALADALWERCGDIILKSAKQGEKICNRELETSVSESLQSYFAARKKAKRNRGESTGTAEPKETGRKHRRAKQTQKGRGNIEDQVNLSAIRMEWQSRDDGLLGEVDLPGNVAYMNDNHTRLKQHRDTSNREAIVDCCLTLIADTWFQNGKDIKKFPGFRDCETMIHALSQLTNSQESNTPKEEPSNAASH